MYAHPLQCLSRKEDLLEPSCIIHRLKGLTKLHVQPPPPKKMRKKIPKRWRGRLQDPTLPDSFRDFSGRRRFSQSCLLKLNGFDNVVDIAILWQWSLPITLIEGWIVKPLVEYGRHFLWPCCSNSSKQSRYHQPTQNIHVIQHMLKHKANLSHNEKNIMSKKTRHWSHVPECVNIQATTKNEQINAPSAW